MRLNIGRCCLTYQCFGNGIRCYFVTDYQDAATVYKRGVYINTVNIGGMKFTQGKKMITHFISVDDSDIEAFKFLDARGIELEVRKVPSDRKQLLMDILKKGNHI